MEHKPEEILTWCMWYFENVPPMEVFQNVTGNEDYAYIEEKVRRYRKDYSGFIGWLDMNERRKLVDLAIAKYSPKHQQ